MTKHPVTEFSHLSVRYNSIHYVVAYLRSSSAAGWTSAWLRGRISPINSGMSMTGSASAGDLHCDCVRGEGVCANADGVGLLMTYVNAGPALYQD